MKSGYKFQRGTMQIRMALFSNIHFHLAVLFIKKLWCQILKKPFYFGYSLFNKNFHSRYCLLLLLFWNHPIVITKIRKNKIPPVFSKMLKSDFIKGHWWDKKLWQVLTLSLSRYLIDDFSPHKIAFTFTSVVSPWHLAACRDKVKLF